MSRSTSSHIFFPASKRFFSLKSKLSSCCSMSNGLPFPFFSFFSFSWALLETAAAADFSRKLLASEKMKDLPDPSTIALPLARTD